MSKTRSAFEIRDIAYNPNPVITINAITVNAIIKRLVQREREDAGGDASRVEVMFADILYAAFLL
ncbi:MAG: hypothetical protein PVSMB5_17760 [Ktedonobacteraceae bacterium]